MKARDPRFYVSPLNSLSEVDNGARFVTKVLLRDVTLREGEQASSVAFSVEDKVEIGRQLDEAGFPQIEVGYGSQERETIAAMKRAGINADLAVLVPGFRSDWQEAIDNSLEVGVDIVEVLYRSSDEQLRMLGLEHIEALRHLSQVVEYVVNRGSATVAFVTSFSTLAKPAFLRQMYKAAYEAGASCFGIADSTGVATPETIAFLVRLARDVADVPVSVHAHNDFGLAVANTIAGLRAGATIADTSVLGLGERAGNAPGEEVAVALEGLFGVDTAVQLEKLHGLAQAVSRIARVPIGSYKAVVGVDVFAQKLEMHVKVTSRDPTLHEPYAPDLVGHRRILKLGSGSGPVAVKAKLVELGLHVPEQNIEELVAWVNHQALASKRDVADAEFVTAANCLAVDSSANEEPRASPQ